MPRRSCSIPGLSCAWDAHASLGLCRSLLPLAFDLEKSSDRGGSEAHGASKSRPSDRKLALVAYWYGPAVCAESSRHIWHIRMVNARPGARMRLRSTGRPLPAYSRRMASLEAARSLCHAYGMHASRWQQQACVWNAAADGTCVRHHRNRCDLIEVAAPEWLPCAACSKQCSGCILHLR